MGESHVDICVSVCVDIHTPHNEFLHMCNPDLEIDHCRHPWRSFDALSQSVLPKGNGYSDLYQHRLVLPVFELDLNEMLQHVLFFHRQIFLWWFRFDCTWTSIVIVMNPGLPKSPHQDWTLSPSATGNCMLTAESPSRDCLYLS